jgi:hypothetical protein
MQEKKEKSEVGFISHRNTGLQKSQKALANYSGNKMGGKEGSQAPIFQGLDFSRFSPAIFKEGGLVPFYALHFLSY